MASAGDVEHDSVSRDDFPYYDGRPVALSAGQWGLLLVAVALGYAELLTHFPFGQGPLGDWVAALLYPGIPLAGLAWLAGRHGRALFRRLRWRDLGWMLGIALLNLAVSVVVGSLVTKSAGTAANPAFAMLAGMDGLGRALFFLRTLPQLLGEEVMTMLPFLALLWLLHTRFGLGRKLALGLAWLGSALLFGAAHLPTYDWNWLQCLVVIGIARLVLSLAYLATKNLWVSTGAHVLNDWIMFGTVLALGSAAAPAAG